MEHLKLHVEPEVDGGAHIEDITDDKAAAAAAKEAADRVSNPPPNFRPTRKVRDGECTSHIELTAAPGGKTSLGSSFFGGFEDETEDDRSAARASTGGKKTSDKQVSSSLGSKLTPGWQWSLVISGLT